LESAVDIATGNVTVASQRPLPLADVRVAVESAGYLLDHPTAATNP